jgi:formylglycine-generating enzyme required for sulfatase activity
MLNDFRTTDGVYYTSPIKISIFILLFIIAAGFAPVFSQDSSFEPYAQEIPGAEEVIQMTPIPGGTFEMGSPSGEQGRDEDEGPAKEVTVDAFWMGVHEITWAQYDLFVEEKMSSLKTQIPENSEVGIEADAVSLPTPPYIDMSFGMGRDGFPAASMTQYAAVMYAKWLTAKTGTFYRLPTEAEWEYACRAGSSSAYYYGDDVAALDQYGWHKGNSEEKYHKVAEKEPNEWGLYDMMGNVAEWTMDQYYEDYYNKLGSGAAENPWFKPEDLYPRSIRGGSWSHQPEELRCAERQGSDPEWKRRDPQLPKSRWWHTSKPFFGFRLVSPKEQPSTEEMEKYWLEAIEDY